MLVISNTNFYNTCAASGHMVQLDGMHTRLFVSLKDGALWPVCEADVVEHLRISGVLITGMMSHMIEFELMSFNVG